jgi:tRNA(Arg) A34 adenosine deaminase TadA
VSRSTPDTTLGITVPGWVDDVVATFPGCIESEDDRMSLVIALARHNVENGGGPFGAAVFLGSRFVAAGVNRVLDTGFSIAHAEIVALMGAQTILGTTGGELAGSCSLVASTEPCCQCFGALVWSGVDHVCCGATTADAEAVGFDEGPKPEDWVRAFESRGISVTRFVRREEARAVLEQYARRGGTIYGRRHRPAR